MKKNIFYFLLMGIICFISCQQGKKQIVKPPQKEIPKKALSFKCMPKKPVNGKLSGVIELGASGLNFFIVNIDKDKNWEIKRKEFGNSLIIQGTANISEINKKLKLYIQEILKFGVSSKDIHFVVSSGAVKSNISKTIIKELKSIGYLVNIVTPEQEAIYTLKSILPNRFKTVAHAIDIGSGNTKISYYNNEKIVGKESHGSMYFQKNIEDKKVYGDVKKEASKIPKSKRYLCFIMGGVPYKMAKKMRNGKERFTVLSSDVVGYNDLKKKKERKVESGLNIYKAIVDETNCKRFVFDWDANFSIGFLLDLPSRG